MTRLAAWFSLVKFSHSVFALPFALIGAWLAGGGVPGARVCGLVVLCAVAPGVVGRFVVVPDCDHRMLTVQLLKIGVGT